MENFNRLSGKMLYGLKKGQCHEIFQTFLFDKKNFTWAPNAQAKTVLQNFSFREDICKNLQKNVGPRSH